MVSRSRLKETPLRARETYRGILARNIHAQLSTRVRPYAGTWFDLNSLGVHMYSIGSLSTWTRNICLKNRYLSYIHIQVTCCWRAFIHWQAAIELLDERDTRYMSPDLSTQWMAAREAARAAEERHEPEGGSRSRLPGGRKREDKRSDRSSWHSRSALAPFFVGATKRE